MNRKAWSADFQPACPGSGPSWPMGYQVTKAYFDRAADKRKAVAVTNNAPFLKVSGYMGSK